MTARLARVARNESVACSGPMMSGLPVSLSSSGANGVSTQYTPIPAVRPRIVAGTRVVRRGADHDGQVRLLTKGGMVFARQVIVAAGATSVLPVDIS